MNWREDPTFQNALALFAKVLDAFSPYREDLLLAGGFAAFLYRFAHEDLDTTADPVLTFDLDCVVPTDLRTKGRPGLTRRLEDMGLALIPIEIEQPSKKVIADRTSDPTLGQYPPCYAEILTNAKLGRTGPVELPVGLEASALKTLWILGIDPVLEIDLATISPTELHGLGTVRLPHPLHFILQKVLLDRVGVDKVDKTAKDAAYVIQTARLFYDFWDDWKAEWAAFLDHPQATQKLLAKLQSRLEDEFCNASSPRIQGASRQIDQQSPQLPENTPPAFAVFMRSFVDSVFQRP